MPFVVVSGVGRGMGVDWNRDRRRERGSFGVNVGRPIVTSGIFSDVRGDDTALPKLR